MKKIIFLFIVIALLVITSCGGEKEFAETGSVATVYKSPSCGCCVGWIPHLEKAGYSVDKKNVAEMSSIKNRYNIPESMEACHTAIIGDYFVEGHVPMEAIEKLIREQPDIDGIALPGMPSGSPGMPGSKRGTWTIYAVKDGVVSEFMKY